MFQVLGLAFGVGGPFVGPLSGNIKFRVWGYSSGSNRLRM